MVLLPRANRRASNAVGHTHRHLIVDGTANQRFSCPRSVSYGRSSSVLFRKMIVETINCQSKWLMDLIGNSDRVGSSRECVELTGRHHTRQKRFAVGLPAGVANA